MVQDFDLGFVDHNRFRVLLVKVVEYIVDLLGVGLGTREDIGQYENI